MEKQLEIAKRIKELRIEKQLSLSDVAKSIEVPLSSYQEWEQGRRILDVKIYFDLAEKFGVSPRYLILGEKKTQSENEILEKIDQVMNLVMDLKRRLVSLKE